LNTIHVFYAKTILSWGFTIRHRGTSAAQPSYPIPPPTTIVGSFAYPLLRLLGLTPHSKSSINWGNGKLISEYMKPLLEATIVASAGLISPNFADKLRTHPSRRKLSIGLAVYQEMGRIIASPYKSGGSFQQAIRAKFMEPEFFTKAIPVVLPVQAVGATYAPSLKLELIWAFDAEKLSKELDISVDKLRDAARKAIYGIVRIGSKESLVALEEAMYVENPVTRDAGEKVRTRLYIEHSCVEPLDPAFIAEIILPDLRYNLESFYVPCYIGSSNLIIPLSEDVQPPTFRVLDPCKVISIPELEKAVGVARF
jgi:CRISPR-associated protein Cas5a/b/c